MPDALRVANLYGVSRVVIGTALAAAPSLAARSWGLPGAESGAVRLLGFRDVVIGLGALAASADPEAHRRALFGCAAADAADAVVSARGYVQSGRASTVVATVAALGGAIVGAWTATRVTPRGRRRSGVALALARWRRRSRPVANRLLVLG